MKGNASRISESSSTAGTSTSNYLFYTNPTLVKTVQRNLEMWVREAARSTDISLDPVSDYSRDQANWAVDFLLFCLHERHLSRQSIFATIDNLFALQDLLHKRSEFSAAIYLGQQIQRFLKIISAYINGLQEVRKKKLTNFSILEAAAVSRQSAQSKKNMSILSESIPRLNQFGPTTFLGNGGFGYIYRTTLHTETQRIECAVKIVLNERTIDDLKTVAAEKKVISICQHPFILTYYAIFKTDIAHVNVMEYVDGVDFHQLISRIHLPWERKCFYLAKLVVAISYLHFKGFVHRDIKPSNVLIDYTGRLVLIDYDTVRVGMGHFKKQTKLNHFFRRTEAEFYDGQKAGTPSFMSPEILLERSYGRASDWWSFGVSVYKVLTGKSPFRGSSNLLKIKICKGMVPTPMSIPKSGSKLIMNLLKVHRSQRLGSKSYKEIFSHAYFEEIDWERIQELSTETDNYVALAQGRKSVKTADATTQEDARIEECKKKRRSSMNESEGTLTSSKIRRRIEQQEFHPPEPKVAKAQVGLNNLKDIPSTDQVPLLTYVNPNLNKAVTGDRESSILVIPSPTDDIVLESLVWHESCATSTEKSGVSSPPPFNWNLNSLEVIIKRRQRCFGFRAIGIGIKSYHAENGSYCHFVSDIQLHSDAASSDLQLHDVIIAAGTQGALTSTSHMSKPRPVQRLIKRAGNPVYIWVSFRNSFRYLPQMSAEHQNLLPEFCCSIVSEKNQPLDSTKCGLILTFLKNCPNVLMVSKVFPEIKVSEMKPVAESPTEITVTARLYIGDAITAINDIRVSAMSQAQIDEAMSQTLASLIIVPSSILRKDDLLALYAGDSDIANV